MGALISFVLLWQESSLVDRLDDDDPAVRDAASAALAREGERAVPRLIAALAHPSVEVRARARDLLVRLPEYRWTLLLSHPESPFVIRAWNAMVDACVSKRPIPASLWQEIGEEGELRKLRERERPSKIEPFLLMGRIAAEGEDALRSLAASVGVEGRPRERMKSLRRVPPPVPIDLLSRLEELGAGERCQEEIYATVEVLRRMGVMPVLSDLVASDWDLLLRFLVFLRDRPGDRDPRAPRSREEALDRAARGPWMAGLARGLAGYFGRPDPDSILVEFEEAEEEPFVGTSRWTALARVYGELAALDEVLSLRFDLCTEGARPGLPGRRSPLPLLAQRRDDDRAARRKPRVDGRDSPLLEAVCLQGPLEPEALGVVEAIVGTVRLSRHPEIQAGLVRALARGVVEAARR